MAISVMDARISNKGRVELQISALPTDVAGLLDECEAELAQSGGVVYDGNGIVEAKHSQAALEKRVAERLGTSR